MFAEFRSQFYDALFIEGGPGSTEMALNVLKIFLNVLAMNANGDIVSFVKNEWNIFWTNCKPQFWAKIWFATIVVVRNDWEKNFNCVDLNCKS